MPIDAACPECRKSYSLADTQRGKTVVCRECKSQFVVADEEDRRPSRPSRRDEEDERPSRRLSRRDEEDDRPSRRSRRDEDDRDRDRRDGRRGRDEEEDRRPSRKQKASGGGMMLWLLIGGGVGLLLLIGVVVIVLVATGALGPNRVTVENYQKLKPGMTQKEIEAILGSPSRDATNEAIDEINQFGGKEFGKQFKQAGWKVLIWESGKNKITVQFVNDKAIGFGGEFHGPGGAVTRMRN